MLLPELVPDWQARLVREARRKSIHLSGLSVPLGLVFFGSAITAKAIALVLAVSLILEAQRLRGRISLPEVREHEKTRVASYIYYMSGCLLAVLLFPKMIAITAILFLALGDTVSGLVGSVVKNCDVRAASITSIPDLTDDQSSCFSISGLRALGWRVKPLPILAATFAACLLIGALASTFTALPWPVYLCGATGAAFADGVAIPIAGRSLDDNFSIPVLSGALMSGAAWALVPLEKVF